MNTGSNQSGGVDLSNYHSKKRPVNISANVFEEDKKKKKNKVYLIILAVLTVLAIAFWVTYFRQMSAESGAGMPPAAISVSG